MYTYTLYSYICTITYTTNKLSSQIKLTTYVLLPIGGSDTPSTASENPSKNPEEFEQSNQGIRNITTSACR